MYKFGGSCSLGRVVVGSQGQDLGNKQRQTRERDTEETDRQTREKYKSLNMYKFGGSKSLGKSWSSGPGRYWASVVVVEGENLCFAGSRRFSKNRFWSVAGRLYQNR